MCRHCANLTEDKEVVHRFFEVGAERLNEMLPRRIGRPLLRPVTADDIAPVELTVNAVFWTANPLQSVEGYRLIDEAFGDDKDRRDYGDDIRNLTEESRQRLQSMIDEIKKHERERKPE